ncbi:MAG: pseudouridine synthase [Oscillospiraceae bacterium]|nr:pseudouridine synthase [Oscillospiraceae bacterium]
MAENQTSAFGIRIQKAISDAGVASRRKAEELIAQGLVTVNGRKATIGQKVNPRRDMIVVDGVKIDPKEKIQKIYVALNKPRGFVTTMSDEMGRRCVAELVADTPARVYPIGRLDRNSEGLLLLTNDGEFANIIMHPRFHVSKVYRVTVRPDIKDEQVVQMAEGVRLDDGYVTAPAQVVVLEKEQGRVVMQVTINEGKNRQVRRMCEAVGLEVARLKRIAVGPVRLGMLQPGQWRMLTAQELTALKSTAGSLEAGAARKGGRR